MVRGRSVPKSSTPHPDFLTLAVPARAENRPLPQGARVKYGETINEY